MAFYVNYVCGSTEDDHRCRDKPLSATARSSCSELDSSEDSTQDLFRSLAQQSDDLNPYTQPRAAASLLKLHGFDTPQAVLNESYGLHLYPEHLQLKSHLIYPFSSHLGRRRHLTRRRSSTKRVEAIRMGTRPIGRYKPRLQS